MRSGLVVAVLAVSRLAGAQPGPTRPIGPEPPPGATPPRASTPAPPPADPVLAEEIAQALVQRAQELYDASAFVEAKQLALEALAKSPRGAAAEQARVLIGLVDRQLAPEPPVRPDEDVDTSPIGAPPLLPPVDERPVRARVLTTRTHAGLYAGLVGTTAGAFLFDEPAGGAIPVGIAAGLAAFAFAPPLVDRLRWSEGQVRTAGSAIVWGGVLGGLFADLGKREGTTAREVLVSSSIGATAGGLGGGLLARRDRYTAGDIALVDTLAGIGAVGGLTLGMLMQPVETEAYSLNSIIGITGGILIGLVAAPQTNTTPRRMARVAGLSALGGALPFLLYAGLHDPGGDGDEQLVGGLSSLGLLAGAVVGFRLTQGMDRDLDLLPGQAPPVDDAPPALVGRTSAGRWRVGSLAVQPLARALAPQPGLAVPVLGGAW